ncbi:MAG: mandelate racemase/muconate lactonizing enzyme family protein [Verrucomicrobia bacterium]|nr:mandelate racemase/muconate lactonizing enzyme family protein [Verrucomicrobiota bacterium]
MNPFSKHFAPSGLELGRRDFIKKSVLGGVSLGAMAGLPIEDLVAHVTSGVNRNSSPSDLKITDLRYVLVDHLDRATPIIRIDTNQGIYGLGEVRENADPRLALKLKSKILGQNPCNVERIFKSIKRYGGQYKEGSGVAAIETACWDLAGKAFGVPCWQMLGGRFRDKIRLYTDFMGDANFDNLAPRIKHRTEVEGFTWIKMTRCYYVVGAIEGGYVYETENILSQKGIDALVEYFGKVRDLIGYDIPVSADHFRASDLNSMIRLGKAVEPFKLAWMEDPLRWQNTAQLKQLKESIEIPVLTGENMYLKESFKEICDAQAVDIVHPDQASAGGLLETKKIGDYAQDKGISMAQHFTGTAISYMANVHIAAATENSMVLEFHQEGDEIPEMLNMVNVVEDKPIYADGFAYVPDEAPGLGITLNEEGIKAILHPKDRSYFKPTLEWNEWI